MPRSGRTPYAAAMRRFGSPPSADEIEAIARATMKALPSPFADSLEHLVAHILIHEAGHHFGFSDEQMHALEEAVA